MPVAQMEGVYCCNHKVWVEPCYMYIKNVSVVPILMEGSTALCKFASWYPVCATVLLL